MKKIIALFVMFLAFTLNANAQSQSKNIANEMNAKKDYESLAEVATISPEMQDAVVAILVKKHEAFSQADLTEENKKNITTAIDNKLQKILGPDMMKALQNHKSVYAKLISPASNPEVKSEVK